MYQYINFKNDLFIVRRRFKESELKRQAIALKSFYKDGSSFLFTVNSSSNLTKVAKELGYELILKDQMNPDIPNVTLVFKKS